jgi:hypothetical protein
VVIHLQQDFAKSITTVHYSTKNTAEFDKLVEINDYTPHTSRPLCTIHQPTRP